MSSVVTLFFVASALLYLGGMITLGWHGNWPAVALGLVCSATAKFAFGIIEFILIPIGKLGFNCLVSGRDWLGRFFIVLVVAVQFAAYAVYVLIAIKLFARQPDIPVWLGAGVGFAVACSPFIWAAAQLKEGEFDPRFVSQMAAVFASGVLAFMYSFHASPPLMFWITVLIFSFGAIFQAYLAIAVAISSEVANARLERAIQAIEDAGKRGTSAE